MAQRVGVEQYLYLLEQAFDGNDEHSLLANLRSVGEEDWDWLPPNGSRTIRAIVAHVGECKYVYENHAFGDATFRWDQPTGRFGELLAGSTGPPDAVVAWLAVGHRRLLQSVAALDDDDLRRPRRTNWGAPEETRWIVSVMIEHDLYHAGEINHLRALRHGADRWAFEG
jgi:hypothetical protein